MDAMWIRGGASLRGEVTINGAKNAALPLIASTILAPGQTTLRNVPQLRDITTMGRVLAAMGAEVTGHRVQQIDTTALRRHEADYDLVRTMRASILVLGPLLARHGRARVSLPGGCAIGARPVDQHLKGLTRMGAEITLDQGYIEARCTRLHGAEITCDMVTVTGTMNLMMAAVLARGTTVIENAAREPEVEELARMLIAMGAHIDGAGTAVVTIEGVEALHPIAHTIVPDRIEAGTFMVAAAITAGDVLLRQCIPQHLTAVIDKLREAGVGVHETDEGLRVHSTGEFQPIEVVTQPHPGFPTDMQAQLMVLCALANGQSIITETIFENRFMHVPELMRMNAKIHVDGHTAVIRGPTRFAGTTVMASDLRASAALILAALVADPATPTRVRRVYHLDRGYERIERRLRALGATIRRVKEK